MNEPHQNISVKFIIYDCIAFVMHLLYQCLPQFKMLNVISQKHNRTPPEVETGKSGKTEVFEQPQLPGKVYLYSTIYTQDNVLYMTSKNRLEKNKGHNSFKIC